MMPKIVCFKARFCDAADVQYDALHPPEDRDPACDYVIFENVPEETERAGWRVLPQVFDDPDYRRRARHHKALAHVLFPDAEWSLWLDGVYQPLVAPSELIRRYGEDADMVAHPHPRRQCLYREGIKVERKDRPGVIKAQLARYERAGMPHNAGLHATGAILRRHSERMAKFNSLWWQEIDQGSIRDQVSFDYVRWRIPVRMRNWDGWLGSSKLFRWRAHMPSVITGQ